MTLDPSRYSIAWIAPLPIEARAAICLLDRKHSGRFPLERGDDYVFQAGEICGHNIVIATLPAGQEYGTGSAAALAAQVKKYFPSLWFGLLVGVAAGLPRLNGPYPRDIRLGDVLVALPEGESAGLIAYELGKETKDGFKLLRGGHVMAVTEAVVRSAIGNIRLQAPEDIDLILPYYEKIKDKEHSGGTFVDPGQDADILYAVSENGELQVQRRANRPDDRRTRVWYGSIGSGDKLMKNAAKRDALRDQFNLIGLEMEAAGTMNRIPVGVIRGVCDYGDEHKNKTWQPYAAAMAAAYGKAVLAQIGPRNPDRVSHIPYIRNRNFTGREGQLKQLHRMLFKEGRERVAVIGLGGIGKTQIALELAYRVQEMHENHLEDRWSVFWLPAQSMVAFQQALMDLSQMLNLAVKAEDDIRGILRAYLASVSAGQWLLVFDNMDDNAVLQGFRDFLPRSQTGRIVITTRSSQIAVDVAASDVVELDEMSPLEAHILLTTSLIKKPGAEDAAVVADLLERLTYLPLTIGQAAAYMNQSRLPLSAYLRLWMSTDQNMIDLLSKQLRDDTHHSRTQGAVATTWIVSFEAICKEDAGAARLLSFIQWIACRAIPTTMLPVYGSEMDLADSIGTICRYGFISWRGDGKTLDMHRLVHLALRIWSEQKRDGCTRKEDAGIVHSITHWASRIWSNQPQKNFQVKEDASRHLFGIYPSHDWENRAVWRQYLPHVFHLLREARPTQDMYLLKLGQKVGLCFITDGRIREAVEILELIVVAYKEIVADTHPDRLYSQYLLAQAYLTNGVVNEAIKLSEQVVAIGKLVGTHQNQLAHQHLLARAYLAKGRDKEAINLLEHVVAADKKILPEEHRSRLCSRQALARAYLVNGKVKDAIKLLEYVTTIQKRMLAENHPDRLTSQHSLASAYQANGEIKEAVKLFEHVMAIREKILTENHPDRLTSQHSLASAYQANGQIKEAIKILEHVVAIYAMTLAETEPDRLASQHALARAYTANGQIKEAIKILEHVVAIYTMTLAETEPDRLASQHALAMAYITNGQIKEPIEILEHVVAIHTTTLVEANPNRRASQHALALAYLANGQIKETIEILEHVVAIDATTQAETHPNRLNLQHLLAGAYALNGQGKKAIEILEHVVALRKETLAETHPDRLDSENLLAIIKDSQQPTEMVRN